MKILITGSSGHLGEGLVRTLRDSAHHVTGVDIAVSPFTDIVGSINDRHVARTCMQGVEAVIHTATLHKPHVATHTRQQFIDTNITGTLNLLEEAVAARVRCFIFTSTTSTFGDALSPPRNAPAVWITEDVVPRPKNIYGATKTAAEDLCQLFHRNHGLPCIVLRTSRFFPEADDDSEKRDAYNDRNLKINEFLNRRADIEDIVSAHLCALQRAPAIGFGKFIISATTPFTPSDLSALRTNVRDVLRRRVPAFEAVYESLGWKPPEDIDRVYVNERARNALGWVPKYDFATLLDRLRAGRDPRSPLAQNIGAKGYHAGDLRKGFVLRTHAGDSSHAVEFPNTENPCH
jgi:UDP-glucose 4-epimerase